MPDTTASEILRSLDRELWLVTAAAGGRRGGLIATFVTQASLVPELPRVVMGVARQHHTWGLIEASGAFALHLLSERNLDWVWRFGLASGRQGDKFSGLAATPGATGSPVLEGTLAWLDCRVEARLDTGDRTVYLGAAVAARRDGVAPPLRVTRLLELADAGRRKELREQIERDCAVDASAIEAWREARRGPNS